MAFRPPPLAMRGKGTNVLLFRCGRLSPTSRFVDDMGIYLCGLSPDRSMYLSQSVFANPQMTSTPSFFRLEGRESFENLLGVEYFFVLLVISISPLLSRVSGTQRTRHTCAQNRSSRSCGLNRSSLHPRLGGSCYRFITAVLCNS